MIMIDVRKVEIRPPVIGERMIPCKTPLPTEAHPEVEYLLLLDYKGTNIY